MAVPLSPAIAVNPVIGMSEQTATVSPNAPSQMITKPSCIRANCCSLALVTPPAPSRPRTHIKSQPPRLLPPQTMMTTLKLTTVPDRPQAYVHAPAHRGSKLPAPPTMGNPNARLSGLLSAPSFPFASDVSPRHTASVGGKEPGCGIRPGTSSLLERNAPPVPWMTLCACARPRASDALDTVTCKFCRDLSPLPEPEPEQGFHERDSERKAPLIRASEFALPFCDL